jgi:hypothetical protein
LTIDAQHRYQYQLPKKEGVGSAMCWLLLTLHDPGCQAWPQARRANSRSGIGSTPADTKQHMQPQRIVTNTGKLKKGQCYSNGLSNLFDFHLF